MRFRELSIAIRARLEEELGRMMEEEVGVVEAADRWAGLDLR